MKMYLDTANFEAVLRLDEKEYRFDEGKEMAEKLLGFIHEKLKENGKDFKDLSEEQKIRLLIDRSMLSKTSLVSTATHFDLLPEFKKETNFAIWNPVLALISDLKLFYTPDDADFSKFQLFVGSLIGYNLERLGLEPKDGEDDNKTKLRQVVTGLALYSGNKAVIDDLADRYEDDAEKIHPEMRDSVLLAKLRRDPEIFSTYLEKYQSTADPNLKDDYLSALTDLQDSIVTAEAGVSLHV